MRPPLIFHLEAGHEKGNMKDLEKKIKFIEADIAKKIEESYPQPVENETPQKKFNRIARYYMNYPGKTVKDSFRADPIQIGYLIKLGWQCGKKSSEVMEQLGIKDQGKNAKNGQLGAFLAVREALRSQITEWDTCDIYMKFCERARGIIRNLEYQASLIEKAWQDEERRANEDPEYVMKQPYAREHIVLWDMIFKMETKIIEIGIEMNVIGKKGDDKTINFVTSTSLLPDAKPEAGSFQQIAKSPADVMLEDMSEKNKRAEALAVNQPKFREMFKEAALEERARKMFGDDE